MTYAITLNGYYYKGQNHNGPVYGTSVSEAKHFYSRQYAVRVNDEIVGGELVLVPMWAI